jgi:membrane protease YdiL (CAAX protease family)
VRRTTGFFALVVALTVPFWVVSAVVAGPRWAPMGLPVSALAFVCPAIAALIMLRSEHRSGMALLRRAFDVSRADRKIWFLPALGLMPVIMLLSYGTLRLAVPSFPHASPSLWGIPLLFCVYFVAAAGEELGWMGYAFGPMRDRWGALPAALVLGVMWAAWHVPGWLQIRTLAWAVGWFAFTVAARVIIVWLYSNTNDSIIAAVFFHAMINTTASLFPGYGLAEAAAVIAGFTVVTAIVIAFLWGGATLGRFRYAVRRESGATEGVNDP